MQDLTTQLAIALAPVPEPDPVPVEPAVEPGAKEAKELQGLIALVSELQAARDETAKGLALKVEEMQAHAKRAREAESMCLELEARVATLSDQLSLLKQEKAMCSSAIDSSLSQHTIANQRQLEADLADAHAEVAQLRLKLLESTEASHTLEAAQVLTMQEMDAANKDLARKLSHCRDDGKATVDSLEQIVRSLSARSDAHQELGRVSLELAALSATLRSVTYERDGLSTRCREQQELLEEVKAKLADAVLKNKKASLYVKFASREQTILHQKAEIEVLGGKIITHAQVLMHVYVGSPGRAGAQGVSTWGAKRSHRGRTVHIIDLGPVRACIEFLSVCL